MPMPDWETLSLQERNLAYNNRAHVGDAVAQRHLDTWTAASQQLRAAHPHHPLLARSWPTPAHWWQTLIPMPYLGHASMPSRITWRAFAWRQRPRHTLMWRVTPRRP